MRTVNVSLCGRLSLSLALCGVLLGCAPQISLQRGEELSTAGRWEEAAQFYLAAASKDPKNIEIRLALARAMQEASQAAVTQGNELLAAGRSDEAAAAYRRALRYNAENFAALDGLERIAVHRQVQERLARVRERVDKGDWRAAQTEVLLALRLDPENTQARELQVQIAAQLRGEAPPPKTDGEKAAAELFSTQPVTLRFRDTDIKEVFEVLSRTAGVNIITDESLPAKRVTTFFKDLPLREAFNLILVSNRLFAKRVAANTVIVIPDNPAKRQQYDELMVQTFYLTDADAKVAVNLLRTILNTRQIFVNEKLNALVIRDSPEKVALAKKLLYANDRGIGEVEIELEVIEVKADARDNLGLLFDKAYQVKLNVPTVLLSGSVPDQLGVSTLSLPSPAVTLNILKNLADTTTLASPTVRVLDRQKARILIGERRPFQISTLSSSSATIATPQVSGTPAGTIQETRVEFRDVGLKLTLSPTIHLNGEVTIELAFEISSVGAPIGGDLLPTVNTRNLDTFIKVRDGETRLLGGLIQNDTTVTTDKLPFFGDIPLLGRLFSNVATTKIRTDVIISVTPRLVKVVEPPAEDVLTFWSGTAMSFEAGPVAAPAALIPPEPPRPAVPPRVPPPAPPAPGAPGVPGVPGAPTLEEPEE